MAEAETITLKAVNKLTGEIFEVEINPYDPESMADCLLNIKEMAKELEKLEKDVKACATDYMKQNDFKPVELKNHPYRWVYRAAQRKTYNAHTVMQHIDQDLLFTSGALGIATGKLEELMKLMLTEAADLPAATYDAVKEDIKAINESVELTSTKPYVMLEKVSRA